VSGGDARRGWNRAVRSRCSRCAQYRQRMAPRKNGGCGRAVSEPSVDTPRNRWQVEWTIGKHSPSRANEFAATSTRSPPARTVRHGRVPRRHGLSLEMKFSTSPARRGRSRAIERVGASPRAVGSPPSCSIRRSPLSEERAGRGRGRGGLLPARSILHPSEFIPLAPVRTRRLPLWAARRLFCFPSALPRVYGAVIFISDGWALAIHRIPADR
jgi:hypothetical protein